MMNLHQLEIFVAVAETGSFSRAAESVLLTQSTVSQHIAALENEMGVRLFDRTGRGAELTDGGRLFQQHVRQVLAACAGLRQTMARFRGMEDPQLIVGASNIPANYLIPGLLPMLAARYPGIVLSVIAGDSRDIIGRLVAGEVALAIVGDRLDNNDVLFTPLLSDNLLLVVGAGHPWKGRQSVELEELALTPLIVREAGSGSGRVVEHVLQQAGLDPKRLRIVAQLGSNEAVKQAVISGFGAAFLSSLSIGRELEHKEMAVVCVAGVSVGRRFWLATRRERTLSPAAQAFSRLFSEIYAGKVNPADAPQSAPMPGQRT
jgi:DNA-binding transcriptional LysR family regulator